jgi:diacylglycerol kinase (ATP)
MAVLIGLGPTEWAVLCLTIGLVLAAEAANTAVETVCNLVSPTYDPLVKRAKDVAAAGVLISAVAAVGVAAALFLPHLLR